MCPQTHCGLTERADLHKESKKPEVNQPGKDIS